MPLGLGLGLDLRPAIVHKFNTLFSNQLCETYYDNGVRNLLLNSTISPIQTAMKMDEEGRSKHTLTRIHLFKPFFLGRSGLLVPPQLQKGHFVPNKAAALFSVVHYWHKNHFTLQHNRSEIRESNQASLDPLCY